MKKKLATIFLTLLATVCTVFTVLAIAACSNGADKYFQFIINDDGNSYSVTGNGCTGDVEIPASYKGLPVTAFNGFYKNNEKITSIYIPASITEISGMSNLKSVTSVTVSEDNTVYHSENNCIIETESNTLKFGCKTSVIPDYITAIGGSAFSGCSNLTNITIPSNVSKIGGGAFSGCSSLTSITIPDGVTRIEIGTFEDCSGLKKITIPDRVTVIGFQAFYNCSSLKKLDIGEGVNEIEADAFANCKALTEINFNAIVCKNTATVSASSEGVFANAGKSESGITVNIGAKVKRIPAYLFAPKYINEDTSANVKSVVFPENSQCTDIAYSAFLKCSSLENINLPNTLNIIGEWAFSGTKLNSIIIPENVNYLGANVFKDCPNLESVTLEKTYGWNYRWTTTALIKIDEDLSDPAKTAQLLTGKYQNNILERGV